MRIGYVVDLICTNCGWVRNSAEITSGTLVSDYCKKIKCDNCGNATLGKK